MIMVAESGMETLFERSEFGGMNDHFYVPKEKWTWTTALSRQGGDRMRRIPNVIRNRPPIPKEAKGLILPATSHLVRTNRSIDPPRVIRMKAGFP